MKRQYHIRWENFLNGPMKKISLIPSVSIYYDRSEGEMITGGIALSLFVGELQFWTGNLPYFKGNQNI